MPHIHQIRLRAPEPADLDMLYLWENDPEIWCHGITGAPYSRHQLWEYLQNYDADPFRSGQLRLIMETVATDIGNIAESGSIAVGCVDLYDIDPRNRHAWVGILTSPTHRRYGFATKGLCQLKAYCRNSLGLNSLAAVAATTNIPSLKLFEKCGFELRGTLDRWLLTGKDTYTDAAIFQCDL